MKPALTLVALGLTGLALAACTDKNAPPEQHNTCYQVVIEPNAPAKYNVVAKDKNSIEACAAELDTVRYRFMGLGSPRSSITGAYNGTYLFIDSGGMSTAPSLDGGRFVAFGRNDDGRLAIPTTIPQPGPRSQGITIRQDPEMQKALKNLKDNPPPKK